MWWLWTLVAPSLACSSSVSLPLVDALDVPTDVQPWLSLTHFCEGEEIRLRRYVDHELLGAWPVVARDDGMGSDEAQLTPDELDEDTRYRLTAAPPNTTIEQDETFLFYFTTGDSPSAITGLDTPEVDDLFLERTGGSGSSRNADAMVQTTFEALTEPTMLLVRTDWFADPQYELVEAGVDSMPLWWSTTLGAGDEAPPREMCIEVARMSQSGLMSDWSAPSCGRSEGRYSMSCSSIGPSGAGWLLLSLPLLWRRCRH